MKQLPHEPGKRGQAVISLRTVFDLLAGIFHVGVSVLRFPSLQPVSRSVALLATFFGLAGVIVGSVTSLTALTRDHRHGMLAYSFVRFHNVVEG